MVTSNTPASQPQANPPQARPQAKKLSKSATPSKCGPENHNPKQPSQNAYPQAKFDPNPKQKSKIMRP